MAEEPPKSRYQKGINGGKRNELMHVLAHKVPEFSSLLKAGAQVSNQNRNYYYKRLFGGRGALPRKIDSLWSELSGPTEARVRYELFLQNNPNFPDLFKDEHFIYSFTHTLNADVDIGYILLAHSQSPSQYYMYKRQTAESQFRENNPGMVHTSPEFVRFRGDFSSQYELKFFNALLNALTKPLPAEAIREIDIATRGKYSRNLAAAGGGGGAAGGGGGGGYRGGARKTRRRNSKVRKTRRNRRNRGSRRN